VDKRYEPYCINDPLFYESPVEDRGRQPAFDAAGGPVPDGWERTEYGNWIVYRPHRDRVPQQGWKIHSSATLDNAEQILAAVRGYCIPRRIAFKFIRNRRLLLLLNAKSADRFASGKFVTIYPADDTELEKVLAELGTELEGQAGPTILSDLRWGEGPLHVRYAGFVLRTCTDTNGDRQPAIEDPHGNLVPDRRGPFAMPDWVALPEFLRPHLLARNSNAINELPWDIQKALHFSNAGGVYLGTDRGSGEQVVIKEARPHAGLSADGADAVARLERERAILERLAGLAAVPALKGQFVSGGHHFLVLEFVEGATLDSLFVAKYPLTNHDCNEKKVADYTAWALELCGAVEEAARTVHGRGIAIHDLHPSNIMVRSDGRIVFVDWEIATEARERRTATLGSVGFAAPPGTLGVDADRHALACLRLWLFLPLTMLIRLDPGKAEQLGAEIRALFHVPHEFIADAVEVLRGTGPPSGARDHGRSDVRAAFDPSPESWPEIRAALSEAILASATPERDDRLFPGDIAQFAPGGGLGLAYGAAGVLYALEAIGAGRHVEHEQWLLDHALRAPPDIPLGLYDGLHGVAHVLDHLGRRSDALALLDICVERLRSSGAQLPLGFFGGLAGIGLNLVHFAAATGADGLRDLALSCAQEVSDRLGIEADPPLSGGVHPRAGLFYGSSGPALLFLRLYEATGDPALIDLAQTALDQDLARCVQRDDGTLQVNEGWRTMPYLADGSAGILMVLDRFLAHRPVERFIEAATAMRTAAEAQFYLQPGLAHGLAGMILCLCDGSGPGSGWQNPPVAAQLRRLARYAVPFRGGWAFPGEQLLRLSMDLTTGSAGLTLALGAALHEYPVHLPFLGPPADRLGTGREKGESHVDIGSAGAAAG
jgi:tRNA A-37 threonylcarbamoyl transferase component Bud32